MTKGLRLLGHPLHAIISDFPIALLGSSIIWDVVGLVRGETIWWAIAFWDICLGLASAVVAAIAGMVDYVSIEEKSAMRTATRHMLLMLLVVGLYSASLFVRRGPAAPAGWALTSALGLEGTGAILMGVGGWYGGHLVFHHGVGRASVEEP